MSTSAERVEALRSAVAELRRREEAVATAQDELGASYRDLDARIRRLRRRHTPQDARTREEKGGG